MNESNCLACVNTNCMFWWDLKDGIVDPADMPEDFPDMVWEGALHAEQ